MAERSSTIGRAFWATLWASDLLAHGRRRSINELARDSGVPLRTVQRRMQNLTLPRGEHLFPLARAAGMDRHLLVDILAGEGRIAVDVSSGLLQEASSLRDEGAEHLRELRLQAELSSKPQLVQDFFEHTPTPLVITDSQTLRVVGTNPAWEEFMGYKETDALGGSYEDNLARLVHPKCHARVEEGMEEIMSRGEARFRLLIRGASEEYAWCEFVSVRRGRLIYTTVWPEARKRP